MNKAREHFLPDAALTEEQGHTYVVRTNTNSTVIGRTAALAAAKGPWKTYYFIGPDYEWGHRVNADFWEFLQPKKQGVQKMGELWPKLGERDFSSHITTILNAKPEAVFSSLWGGDLIAFVKQASTYGFFDKVQFVSTGAGDLDILKPLGAEMPDGIMATFFYAFDLPVPGKEKDNEDFVTKFKQLERTRTIGADYPRLRCDSADACLDERNDTANRKRLALDGDAPFLGVRVKCNNRKSGNKLR